jgi:hypothetical protein
VTSREPVSSCDRRKQTSSQILRHGRSEIEPPGRGGRRRKTSRFIRPAFPAQPIIGHTRAHTTSTSARSATPPTETQKQTRALTLQRLDDQRAGARHDRHGSLTVLNGQLDGHTETFPVASRLGDVFSDFLGGLCGRGRGCQSMAGESGGDGAIEHMRRENEFGVHP